MQNLTRKYRVGGLCFGVSLAGSWSYMDHTPAVQQRIDAAASGQEVEVLPVRAGDIPPSRTYVCSREDLPSNYGPRVLDFSQYEPFRVDDSSEASFSLSLITDKPAWVDSDRLEHMLSLEEEVPYMYVSNLDGETVFGFSMKKGEREAYLKISDDMTRGEIFAVEGLVNHQLMLHLGTALMIMYTCNCAGIGALLIHASVVRYNGLANIFFGVSGTGKSTHSRLWLENIEGSDLLNDDNPVLRLEDGKVYVYGSPWSGKTPCYRNVKVEVGKIVNLRQAPQNAISEIKGLNAYAGIISSSSSIRWKRSVMEAINATASSIAMAVPSYELHCLPDPDAARLCASV